MSQWNVQIVIGRLMTDQEFRHRFETQARECLAILSERGMELTHMEVTALVETDPRVWGHLASWIDHRLRRVQRQRSTTPQPLTRRQHEVLRGVFEGLTNKQIASALGVSEPAVKATLQQLFRKTAVRTRAQLVRVAINSSSEYR
jgi:DNA-binding NarL/FixJ family response regulator